MDFEANKAFLACNDWHRTHHEGIEREVSRYEKEGLASLTIETRREIMEQEYGEPTTKALDKYIGVVSLTRPQAREILQAVYPLAPDDEIARAVLLCASYQLNPLMKHVFLIKFNRWNKEHTKIVGEEWATVVGIKAKRLLASRPDRRGQARPYSYVDNTPRVMTEDEQKTIFSTVYDDRLWVITRGRDPTTGAEAVGYGFWLNSDKVYGAEKGNSAFNMASVRSESQMLDRLRPGEMPQGVEVIDEQYTQAPFISEGGGKIGGLPADIEGEGKDSLTILPPPKAQNTTEIGVPAAELEGEGFHINLTWLKQNLKELNWTDGTAKTFLASEYKVSPQGTLDDVIKRLEREQAEDFVKKLQEKVEQKQMQMFT